MAHGKAAGKDGIPAEVFQHGGDHLLFALHDVITKCWLEDCIPQDFKDATVIPIFKRKGNKQDCCNYRGVSLLSIAGKIMARILLHRLQQVTDSVLPESQCGFRANRSTTDMIFTLRQLQRKQRNKTNRYIWFS